MTAHFCVHCEKRVEEDAQYCAQCGAPLTAKPDDPVAPDHAEQLLAAARLHQEAGDLEAARRCAHEALSLRPDCAAIHSLLGCLHQQMGHESSARLHFQAALAITPPTTPTPSPAYPPTRPAGTSLWVTLVLVGCVIFSALAMVFVYQPATHQTEQAALLKVRLQRPALPEMPRWTWQQPTPASVVLRDPVVVPAPPRTTLLVADTQTETPPVEAAPPPPEQILGDTARPHTVVLTGAPTVDKADQAYFRGEYELAATTYEAVLRDDETNNPRLHQDLAWCYQQLGSSGKATQHLTEAIRGFQVLLATDPRNTAAQQGLATCQAALRALLATRTP